MITLSPSGQVFGAVGVPLCFEASSIVTIPQEDERFIDLPASGENWTFTAATGKWAKSGGANGAADAPTMQAQPINKLQPFYIWAGNWTFVTPAAPNRFHGTFVGVFDSSTNCTGGTPCFYGWYVYKNCGNQSTGTCNAQNGDDPWANWRAYIFDEGVQVGGFSVNFFENFRIYSDGISLHWEVFTSGAIGGNPASSQPRWVRVYSRALPATETFSFHLNGLWPGNEWSSVKTFRGTYQGQAQLTWYTAGGGTLTGTGSRRCFTGEMEMDYDVCVYNEFEEQVCAYLTLVPLYFRPIGFECGGCVFTGDTVRFESNGGAGGVLTASAGTVLDSLTWQAPGYPVPGGVTLTYTLDGGEDEEPISIDCTLTVLERLRVTNVEGDTITGLSPGDSFQIEVNAPYTVEWTNLGERAIVTPEGRIDVPRRLFDDCFGGFDGMIRGQVTAIDGTACENLMADGENPPYNIWVDLRVIVDPVFPTPAFGGPRPTKWKQETPEFKVIVSEMEGGCDETHLRSRVPTQRWSVNYTGLRYEDEDPCAPPPPCMPEEGYVNGYFPSYQVAKRLDDFWMRVGGQSGYFTLVDYRTGEVWRRVRFAAPLERDHVNWRTTQSRTLSLVWAPCCTAGPEGGVCPHSTVRRDGHAPTTPASVDAAAVSASQIRVSWYDLIDGKVTPRSRDNVGVKGYELEIDGEVTDVGNVLIYEHTGLAQNSTHSYRVRAYDFSGNRSGWSGAQSATTENPDTVPPTVPGGFTASATGYHSVALSWTAASGTPAGYKLLLNGTVLDVGNVTSYNHTGLACGTTYSYYLRSYDAAGNQSPWSAVRTATTTVDTTPPAVAITSHEDNDEVTGTITLTASASDNVSVNRVEWFYFNNFQWNYLSAPTGAPYSASLNTGSISGAVVLVAAIAFDGCGNASTPAFVTLTKTDAVPPSVTITAPTGGDTVSGSITLEAAAEDDLGVNRVEWYVYRSGSWDFIGYAPSAPYPMELDTTKYSGSLGIAAIAYDTGNNQSAVAFVTVTVSN